MDLDLLVACANMGETMVATSYGYASWMGIDITPTFVINGKKKVLDFPKNFMTSSRALATTSTTSRAQRPSAGRGERHCGGHAAESLFRLWVARGAGAGKDLVVTVRLWVHFDGHHRRRFNRVALVDLPPPAAARAPHFSLLLPKGGCLPDLLKARTVPHTCALPAPLVVADGQLLTSNFSGCVALSFCSFLE